VVSLEPLRPSIPEGFWALVPTAQVQTVLVLPFERALVHVDGVLREVLTEGRAAYSTLNRKLEVMRVDLREQEVQILGQELMTRDKVTLRLNLVVKFRVTDPVKAVQSVASLRDALYSEAQMSARHFVAELNLDQLLERRSEAVAPMAEALRERAASWGAEVLKLDVKDLVLPGEMKLLLNQVIEAEKKAAAQVIMRREEVASTRSMANTAQMLERNPALLRLKELEAFKEIASAIPNLTLVMGQPDLLRSLGGLNKD
jgi:regulator of protease activity HflC (stomatin/prohibitin superfamily)